MQQQQLQLPSIQNPTPFVRPQLPVQPNTNPNNKATQSMDAPVTLQNYLITPIGLNEVQIGQGK